MEQTIIIQTPNYQNKINSISLRHSYFSASVEWGKDWVKTMYPNGDVRTNLVFQKRSRPKIKSGDIFCYTMGIDLFYFGRVVIADHDLGPMPGAYLLYFYRRGSVDQAPHSGSMTMNDLLLPPVWTNALAWTKGYFVTIGNRGFEKDELPDVHCFFSALFGGKYVDQDRQVLAKRSEPCGDWMLVSYRWIDDHLSDALGLERVPDSGS